MKKIFKRIVIKVGTNIITNSDGHLNLGVIQDLVNQINELRKINIEVILVTSGAMGAGRSIITLKQTTDPVAIRQVLAAVGQVKLIKTYNDLLSEYGLISAQIMATKEDFRDKTHYGNMKSCLEAILKEGVLPIVNENDVVAVTELMFTDNDELSSLIAKMVKADSLFLLTNVDGIYTGNPQDANSRLIKSVDIDKDNIRQYISEEKSEFGRGGMLSKAEMAYTVAKSGINVYIANGRKEKVVLSIINGEDIGTTFLAK